MIFGSENISPYADDEIYEEMRVSAGEDSDDSAFSGSESCGVGDDEDEVLDPTDAAMAGFSHQLREVVKFYDCADLLSYASYIIWLSNLAEISGSIPFSLDYVDYRCLVILHEERAKKTAFDMKKKGGSGEGGGGGGDEGLREAVDVDKVK